MTWNASWPHPANCRASDVPPPSPSFVTSSCEWFDLTWLDMKPSHTHLPLVDSSQFCFPQSHPSGSERSWPSWPKVLAVQPTNKPPYTYTCSGERGKSSRSLCDSARSFSLFEPFASISGNLTGLWLAKMMRACCMHWQPWGCNQSQPAKSNLVFNKIFMEPRRPKCNTVQPCTANINQLPATSNHHERCWTHFQVLHLSLRGPTLWTTFPWLSAKNLAEDVRSILSHETMVRCQHAKLPAAFPL